MAQGSALRKQKRMTLKAVKKQLPPRNPSPTNPLEVPHLRRLEADLEQLGSAFNHNAKLYSHALTIAEMRLRVLERAMNDMLAGKGYVIDDDGVKRIDFDAYNNELAFCMIMAEFAAWCKRLMDANAPEPLIYQPGYNDDTTVFGGGP